MSTNGEVGGLTWTYPEGYDPGTGNYAPGCGPDRSGPYMFVETGVQIPGEPGLQYLDRVAALPGMESGSVVRLEATEARSCPCPYCASGIVTE